MPTYVFRVDVEPQEAAEKAAALASAGVAVTRVGPDCIHFTVETADTTAARIRAALVAWALGLRRIERVEDP